MIRAGPLAAFEEGRLGGRKFLLRSDMKKLATCFLDFLFPIYCVGCSREKTHCCDACLEKIGSGEPAVIDGIFSAAVHREHAPLAKLIHRFKYDSAEEIGRLLALLTEKIIAQHALRFQNAVLVPVPLHWRRKNQRGFNQSEILAYTIGKMHGMEMKNILARHRFTRPQVELDRNERLKNPVGAFSLKHGAHVDPSRPHMLVDDVATTGTTLRECAKILHQNGAKMVRSLVIARAL